MSHNALLRLFLLDRQGCFLLLVFQGFVLEVPHGELSGEFVLLEDEAGSGEFEFELLGCLGYDETLALDHLD